jgi:hypothetical protein
MIHRKLPSPVELKIAARVKSGGTEDRTDNRRITQRLLAVQDWAIHLFANFAYPFYKRIKNQSLCVFTSMLNVVDFAYAHCQIKWCVPH